MSLGRLAFPPPRYSPEYETRRNQAIDDLRQRAYTGGADLVLPPGLGIILYSPDGNPWRVTVSNAGALVVTAYTP